MGMTCTVYRATDEEIDRLLEEPAGLADFLDPDDASALRVRTVRPSSPTHVRTWLPASSVAIVASTSDPTLMPIGRGVFRNGIRRGSGCSSVSPTFGGS
jgi:hypothetical protein